MFRGNRIPGDTFQERLGHYMARRLIISAAVFVVVLIGGCMCSCALYLPAILSEL